MKLFYRLLSSLLIGTMALICLDEYINYKIETKQFKLDLMRSAEQIGTSLSGVLRHAWEREGEAAALELLAHAQVPHQFAVRWIDQGAKSQGQFVLSADELHQLEQGMVVHGQHQDQQGEIDFFTFIPVGTEREKWGALEIKQPMVAVSDYSHKMMLRAILIILLFTCINAAILYFFMNRSIRVPLKRLIEQVERIGHGDLCTTVAFKGNDELSRLAQTLNEMCSRLLIAKEKIKFECDARLKTLEQLRHTERLSTFGLLSAGIAHEIGTPLNVVDGRAKMIIREELSPEEINECATIIQNQAERMTTIIRQLLDFTRRPKYKPAQENIVFLMKQVFQFLSPMANKQNVEFALHVTPKAEVMLQADGSQLQQVFVNLLMNAIQAMPEGGKVDISVGNLAAHSKLVPKGTLSSIIELRIEDEGEGIAEKNLKHIFTPFFTTKTLGTGTGLGLSIAHGIVEEHGGWIDVESAPGKGTCFSIYLPVKKAAV
ncbi:HAMP domain-containing protein [Desulfobulbus rhabdoformis]|uniref:sensor histidine kinase n=1 Tax=Desulfobulbus rhabdoformis TaxID=34032 RepID=UPI0019653FB7|nr:HAMP domain-containing sensor histidine kinase [Desulfobulbus rhabdoformis]MBM9614366.1 HAMP domain-containing protein [Desulfobulbus rhabdoformis]